METSLKEATPKIMWGNIAFFALTTLFTVIGVPLYLFHFSIQPFYIWFTLIYILLIGMSISAGYHRLFSHVTYQAHPVIQFLFLFFGAGAFQNSAAQWSSQHRTHHNQVATDNDPYSIKKGFFYAHIGWLLFWKYRLDYANVKDLTKNRLILHQHNHYLLWAITSGIVVPLLVGFWYGDLLAAFLFPICLRIVVVHQATFCINSVCHVFGKEPYDLVSTAKDNWVVALFTNGEGFHNYHHRFPSDYRNGMRWYQFDSAKWLISLLAIFRLTKNLKKMAKFTIEQAKLKVDQQQLLDLSFQVKRRWRLERFYSDREKTYKVLNARLLMWKQRSEEYGNILYNATVKFSEFIRNQAKQRMKSAKSRFHHGLKQWNVLEHFRRNISKSARSDLNSRRCPAHEAGTSVVMEKTGETVKF